MSGDLSRLPAEEKIPYLLADLTDTLTSMSTVLERIGQHLVKVVERQSQPTGHCIVQTDGYYVFTGFATDEQAVEWAAETLPAETWYYAQMGDYRVEYHVDLERQ